MAIATPFPESKHAFYYNQKINCLPAEGELSLVEQKFLFQPGNSFGVLDWGRGVWSYSNTNPLILQSNQHQVFGHFSGKAIPDNGQEIRVRNLLGFAEKVLTADKGRINRNPSCKYFLKNEGFLK